MRLLCGHPGDDGENAHCGRQEEENSIGRTAGQVPAPVEAGGKN